MFVCNPMILQVNKKMTNTKNRTQSKMLWEKARRNRFCEAFTALAEILPSTPSTTTKLLILRRAIKYIKELQKRNDELQGGENKDPASTSMLMEKLSILEERCSQLIHYMQQNGLQMSSSLLLNTKDLTSINLSSATESNQDNVKGTKHNTKEKNNTSDSFNSEKSECSNKANSSSLAAVSSSQSNIEPIKTKESNNHTDKDDKIIKKSHLGKKKCCKENSPIVNTLSTNVNISHSNIVTYKDNTANNVRLPSNNQNTPIVIGNEVFSSLPKSSIIMTSTPQIPTIFLLQRPVITDQNNASKNNMSEINLHPLSINLKEKQKSCSSMYGVNLIKPTLKVPISAYPSSASGKSKSISKSSTFRVSAKARRKFLKSLKAMDQQQQKKSETEVKETVETKITSPSIKNIESSSNVNDCSQVQRIEQGKEMLTDVNLKKESSGIDDLKQIDVQKVSKKSVVNENEKGCINDTVNSGINLHNTAKSNCAIEASENKITVENDNKVDSPDLKSKKEFSNPSSSIQENSVQDSDKNLRTYSKVFDNCPNNEDYKSRKQEEVSESYLNKPQFSKNDKVYPSFPNTCKQNSHDNVNQDPHYRLHTLKPSNAILSSSEIAEDFLASFVAPQEQTLPTSPLASPLATSPTAAFLLAFPLVCSGPRPDTPLNDNLQTPNICALDNFSTFFSSKESGVANNIIPVSNSQSIFTDCQSKQSPQIISEKNKHNFSNSQSTSQTYLKSSNVNEVTNSSVTEIPDSQKYNLKNDTCSRPLVHKTSAEKTQVTSSTCIYSNAPVNSYNSKDVQFSHNDSLFNYDGATSSMNQRDHTNAVKDVNTVNVKQTFSFENSSQNNLYNKSKSDNNNDRHITTEYSGNSNVGINHKSHSYGVTSLNSETQSNSKKSQGNESSMKLVLPGVIPEYSTASKNIEMPFGFQSQAKTVFSNSSNIYTSCNTYNPFSSDFSSNSMNLTIPCGNSMRTKSTTTYFPEFNTSNIYSQNCNIWNDENQIDFDPNKLDYNRKLNIPMTLNQNQTHSIIPDYQSNTRLSVPVISKSSTNRQNPIDVKNNKNSKCINREAKYPVDKNKPEFLSQKGPVNWMTSDVTQHNNEGYFPNYKDVKSEHNALNSNQICLDTNPAISTISSLNCKKSDIFEQSYFPIQPSGYVTQVVSEDNQFTWSPSKFTSFTDNSSLAPCSLPTLVGDLALGITSESKTTYQSVIVEQESNTKDRKNIPQKNKETYNNKPNYTQSLENSSHMPNSFLSVSQLMERGKNNESIDNSKVCTQAKRNTIGNDDKTFNANLSNKSYNTNQLCVPSSVYSSDNFAVQPSENVVSQKDSIYNNKVDTNSKAINKNNYSTEALLQNNDVTYQNARKTKLNVNLQKMYGENSSYPIHGNQFLSSNHSLQFDNFSQNQQYANSTFPYNGSSMNTAFYSSSNFIPSTNSIGASNYISNGYTTDLCDFQNTNENTLFPSKIENYKSKTQADNQPDYTKYPLHSKAVISTKDQIPKIKSDNCKKDVSVPNKRQKKQKICSNNFGMPEKPFNSIAGQVNSPLGLDESFFGYTSNQMHPYQTQSALIPTAQSSAQYGQKLNFIPKSSTTTNMTGSPTSVGTSLTNFNLSTIFPEINKRSSMPGFNEPQHTPGNFSKTSLYH